MHVAPDVEACQASESGMGGGRARERDESFALRRLLPARLRLVRQPQHVTRLTAQSPADLLKGGEIDAHRPPFLQTPEGRVADARLLRQPVEGPPALFQ